MTRTPATSPTDVDTPSDLVPTHLAEPEITTMTIRRPTSQPRPEPHHTHGPLLTQRAALLLLVAVVFGGLVGSLTFAATPVLAAAVVAGLLSAGAVLLGGHQLIE